MPGILAFRLVGPRSRFDRVPDRAKQDLSVDRLAEQRRRADGLGTRLYLVVVSTRDHDSGDADPVLSKPRLCVQPAKSRHVSVENQAGGMLTVQRLEQLLHRGEGASVQPVRIAQTAQGDAHRLFVVNYCDQRMRVHHARCLCAVPDGTWHRGLDCSRPRVGRRG